MHERSSNARVHAEQLGPANAPLVDPILSA
jgi:hypothetical protein